MNPGEYKRGSKGKDLEKHLFEGVDDIDNTSSARYCEHPNCKSPDTPLPENYDLKFCPECRKESISEFLRENKNQAGRLPIKSFPFHDKDYSR